VTRLVLIASIAWIAACDAGSSPHTGAPPDAPAPFAPALLLRASDVSADHATIDVVYERPADRAGPRAAEIHLRASPDLHLVASEPLDATRAAGKHLVVQARDDGVLRAIVYSTADLRTLGPGGLVRLRFDRAGAGDAVIELLDRRPVFAPAEADEGLALPPPLRLTEGGAR
jgi:hypothetical protein